MECERCSPAWLYCAGASQGRSCITDDAWKVRSSSLIFSSSAMSSALRPLTFLSVAFDPYWRRSFTTYTTHMHFIMWGGRNINLNVDLSSPIFIWQKTTKQLGNVGVYTTITAALDHRKGAFRARSDLEWEPELKLAAKLFLIINQFIPFSHRFSLFQEGEPIPVISVGEGSPAHCRPPHKAQLSSAPEEPGTEPATFQSLVNQLYPLRYSCPSHPILTEFKLVEG